MDIDAMFQAYVTCALWSSTDDSGDPMDASYDAEDIADDALASMREDCETFADSNVVDLAIYCETFDASQAGHDFWLTRNHHGAGFWDRVSAPHRAYTSCKRLTDAAHAYGDSELYVGDDGRVYV